MLHRIIRSAVALSSTTRHAWLPSASLLRWSRNAIDVFNRAAVIHKTNFHDTAGIMATKRKASGAAAVASSPKKKKRPDVPDYHLTPSVKDDAGNNIWPAPQDQMERARAFILDCATSREKTLIVPDKDTDGLSSGAILYRTLTALGMPAERIGVHLLQKGNTIHTESERLAMAAHKPKFIIILDQGSRKAPPVIDGEHRALIIDHHFAEDGDFPKDAEFCNACHCPPVATSSLLTYLLCQPLNPEIKESCDWLCVMGTQGDLGNTLKWQAPFPDMQDTFKRYTKKTINDAISQINAPRRTATYDVRSAWDTLINSNEPAEILKNRRLMEARYEVNDEVERCTHTAPKFTPDGKVAVFRIKSEAQVHPVIATRWAGHLTSNKLDFICVANSGYLPDKVNFSCRIPRCARSREPPVDIIQSLRAYARADSTGDLFERLGEDFAHGHKEASGGIVDADVFEELMASMKVGEKPEKSENEDSSPSKKKLSKLGTPQKNTLANYFGKAAA